MFDRERDTIIYNNEVYVVDTCCCFDGWETMIAKLDIEKIREFFYEGLSEDDDYKFDLSSDFTQDFISEWAEEPFEFLDYHWQGQRSYANRSSAIKGHKQACKNPVKWIEKYE